MHVAYSKHIQYLQHCTLTGGAEAKKKKEYGG